MIDVRTWWAEGHPLLRDSWVRKDDYTLNWLGNLSNAYRHHTRWARWSWWSYIWRAPERWTYTRPMKQYREGDRTGALSPPVEPGGADREGDDRGGIPAQGRTQRGVAAEV